MLRKSHGFTVVELIVVVAIIGIILAFIVIYLQTYKDAARFSNTVRIFHNSLNEARIKAVGNQATVRLIPRPQDSPANEPLWAYSTSYTVGAMVTRQGLSYRCIQGHTSDANASVQPVNQPILGSGWRTYWDLPTLYFWYHQDFGIIKDCTGAATPADCKDARPYSATAPVKIEFNSRGYTADYIDHVFTLVGTAQQSAGEPGVRFTISPLGMIVHAPTPRE